MKTSIELVEMGRYVAPLGAAPDGRIAMTHLATLNWPDDKPGRFFVKVYDSVITVPLVNEITGYLLAKACGLPQPPRVGLVQVPLAVFGKSYTEQTWCWGWASEEFGQNPKTVFTEDAANNFDRVKEELLKWSRLKELISFDDWVANQDRNIGNVTLLGPGKFGIIDHGGVPVHQVWKPDDLVVDQDFKNLLLTFLWNDAPNLPDARALVVAAKSHPEAYDSVDEELKFWWSQCGLDTQRASAMHQFFSERASRGYDRLTKRIGLLAA